MAIKRKDDQKKTQELPEKFSALCLKSFSLQAIAKRYEDQFKESKGELVEYLETNEDGMDVDLGKGIKCDQGMIIYTTRNNYKINTDLIIEMIKDGAVSLETILGLATLNAEKLKVAIGETAFNVVATNAPTESLTLRASAEFKALCEDKFIQESKPAPKAIPAEPAKQEPAPKAKKKSEPKAVDDSKAKALAAAAKLKSKSKTPEQDLNDILGE